MYNLINDNLKNKYNHLRNLSIYLFMSFLPLLACIISLRNNNNNCSSLDDLMMEKGGRPMRSVILATWRSGSTFLGDVLQAHPANFYHYEPLLDFGITQVRGPPMNHRAIKNLYALFNCEYHKLGSFF